MKLDSKLLAIHKTFDFNKETFKRELTAYVYDGKKCHKLSQKQLNKLELKRGTQIRVTSTSSSDSFLKTLELLVGEGNVVYAYWHDLGLAKGLSPEGIVKGLYESKTKFRKFRFNAEIANLTYTVQLYNGLTRHMGDLSRRIQQVGRNMGIPEKEDMADDPILSPYFEVMGELKKRSITYPKFTSTGEIMKRADGTDMLVGIEKQLDTIAQEIPLCRLFNKVAGFKDSYKIAASIVSIIQDIDRFPNVGKLWAYFGMDVDRISGKARKKVAGEPANWNQKGRVALYNLGLTIVKQTETESRKANPWRAYYDEAKAFYTAANAAKPKKEQVSAAQVDARARRKLVKEILKRFYLAAAGKPLIEAA